MELAKGILTQLSKRRLGTWRCQTWVNTAPVNKVKGRACALAVGQLLQGAMFDMLYLLQASVGV